MVKPTHELEGKGTARKAKDTPTRPNSTPHVTKQLNNNFSSGWSLAGRSMRSFIIDEHHLGLEMLAVNVVERWPRSRGS